MKFWLVFMIINLYRQKKKGRDRMEKEIKINVF